MNPQQEMLTRKLGLTMEEAGVALELFRNPLPARAQLHTGLVIRLLPGAVPSRTARGMVKRGWLKPDVHSPLCHAEDRRQGQYASGCPRCEAVVRSEAARARPPLSKMSPTEAEQPQERRAVR